MYLKNRYGKQSGKKRILMCSSEAFGWNVKTNSDFMSSDRLFSFYEILCL